MSDTPKKLGFVAPAEWEKHSAIWLAWPHDTITFGSLNEKGDKLNKKRLPLVEKKYVEIIKAISPTEDVELLVRSEEMQTKVTEMLTKAKINLKDVSFTITDYADVWLRDYGPFFINNNPIHEQAWVKWTYNAYGEKFQELLKDNEVFLKLRGNLGKRMFEPEIILESGAFDVNGNGIVLTTEQCLLSPNRNPHLTKLDYEKYFSDLLSAKKTIWLMNGLIGDHTDGHIDEIARFVSRDTIVCAYEEDEQNPNFAVMDENFKLLEKATDPEGNKFKIIKLPLPHLTYSNGEPVPASYTNFYIGNEVVLAAVFKDENDKKAIEILKECFPDRKIVPIDCSQIIYGGGAIHCMTMQQPVC